MESSIAVFLMRWSACELPPTLWALIAPRVKKQQCGEVNHVAAKLAKLTCIVQQRDVDCTCTGSLLQ